MKFQLEIDPVLFKQQREWLIAHPTLPYESSCTDRDHCEGLIGLMDSIADQMVDQGERGQLLDE